MSLEYKILWIDDQIDDIQNQIELVKQFVLGEGMIPKIVVARENTDIARRVAALNTLQGTFDLTVVDFHLADDASGAHVACDIRRRSVADVIFYSATDRKELLRQLHELSVDGVFVANRREIVHRVREIFSAHTKWAINVTAMRGISTSTVSEIDHLIFAVIREATRHAKLEEADIVQKIVAYLGARRAEQEDDFKRLESTKTLDELAHSPAFGSDFRFKFLKSIWDKLPDNFAVQRLKENLARYDERVLVHRNTLAHGKTVNDGIELTSKRKLTAAELRDLRVAIRDHHLHFSELLDQLRNLS
jgi:DNA-binding NarL/FixJ family response regulator